MSSFTDQDFGMVESVDNNENVKGKLLIDDEEDTSILSKSTHQLNKMVAIFSVVFDKNTGPIIEWQYPADVKLEGIEFSALASGLHDTTGPDLVYFRHILNKKPVYALSVYRRHMRKGMSSRDCIMRCVGVCCGHYAYLHEHYDFLADFVE
eukprot:TRINITY_DN5048_c0_g1_i1.p1 TRINITY_DN5048_c0_g1~~TRINITY_DN5048_c0_g1_i1.p1  ORF type:complete len:151 (+),score=22.77 TRINITY_DN5048_c0_g1_i1:45-497(+)